MWRVPAAAHGAQAARGGGSGRDRSSRTAAGPGAGSAPASSGQPQCLPARSARPPWLSLSSCVELSHRTNGTKIPLRTILKISNEAYPGVKHKSPRPQKRPEHSLVTGAHKLTGIIARSYFKSPRVEIGRAHV